MRGVFRSTAIESEFAEELASHLQLHVDDNLRLGMSADEARRQAVLCLGSLDKARQQYREEAAIPLLLHRVQDFLHALYELRRSAVYSTVLVFSLALGMGAATSVFGVLDNILLSAYPYAHARGMFHLLVLNAEGRLVWPLYTAAELERVRRSAVVDSAIGYRNRELVFTGRQGPETVVSTDLTPNAFTYLGVPVISGRPLLASDSPSAQPAHPVVVLGYAFWRKQLNGDAHVLGKTIQLSHRHFTIVGVAAPRFTWGDGDLFLPADIAGAAQQKLEINLRLRPRVTQAAAQQALHGLLQQFAAERNPFPHPLRTHLTPLNEPFLQQSRSILQLLCAAAVLLFLIVCGNACLLATARIAARRQHLARMARLGASRLRLFSYLMAEFSLLSLAGAGLGLLLAVFLTPVTQAALPAYSAPSEAATGIGFAACLACALLGLLCIAILGSVSAVTCARASLDEAAGAGRKSLTRLTPVRLHLVLIVGEVALTTFLLFAGGLAVQTWLRLSHSSLGYSPTHVIAAALPVNETTYPTWQARSAYLEQLLAILNAAPKGLEHFSHRCSRSHPTPRGFSVKKSHTPPAFEVHTYGRNALSAAVSSHATPPNDGLATSIEYSGPGPQRVTQVSAHFVSAGYFSVLRVPMLAGAVWSGADETQGAPVAVINQTMERRLFGHAGALGRRIRLPRLSYLQYSLPAPSQGQWIRIVGVTSDFRDGGLDKPIAPALYLPFSALLGRGTQLLVRGSGSPAETFAAASARIHGIHPDQQLESPPRDLAGAAADDPGSIRARLLEKTSVGSALAALLLAAVSLFFRVRFVLSHPRPAPAISTQAPRTTRQRAALAAIVPGTACGIVTSAFCIAIFHAEVQAKLLTSGSALPFFAAGATLVTVLAVCVCLSAAWRVPSGDLS